MSALQTIRPVTDGDLPAIEKIVREIWGMGVDAALEEQYGLIGGKPWQDWASKSVIEFMRKSPDYGYVIEIDGEIAGFGNYSLNTEKRIGTIGYNGVSPRFRGQGLGTKLLDYGLSKIKNSGMQMVVVMTGLNNGFASARRMYEKAGFAPVIQNVTYAMRIAE